MSENSTSSFATKYRPIKLKDLVGQKQIKQQIAGMLKNGSLPTALLLTGLTGCGKTTIARVIARHINKTLDISEMNDIFEINIGTSGTAEDIRNLIQRIRYMPRNPEHKSIYILDEVHRLTKTSASALLKEIEEPPAHVMFILCTNEPDQLLDTIRNRCEKICLKAYSEEEMFELLQHVCTNESININEETLKTIAINGNNQPRECLAALQAVANLIKGGNKVTPEELEAEIKNAVGGSLFELANQFLICLYTKNYSGAIRRIDICGDALGLLNISILTSRSLVKYFSSLKNKGYNPEIPFHHKRAKDQIKAKTSELSLDQIIKISSEVHQLLTNVLVDSRRINVEVQDLFFTQVGRFCLE